LVVASFVPAAGDARAWVDAVGREVSIPTSPCRIVSLAPNITETLFALGLDELIVGVTRFCNYPREAASKEKVGGLINPSLEKIVSLRPDLIIGTADGNRKETIGRLERIGLPVYVVNPGNFDEILEMILSIGKITGRGHEAIRLVDSLRGRIERVALLTKNAERPKVFFQVGAGTLITAGKGTFTDMLIKLAGGRNIAGDATIRYPRLSIEEILFKNPDIIIVSSERGGPLAPSVKESWKLWKDISAVKKGTIHLIDPDLVSRPAPRIVKGLETMARIIHPEIAW